MLLCGNVSVPEFQTKVSIFDDLVLVQKIVNMCYVLLAIDIPVATYFVVPLPIKT